MTQIQSKIFDVDLLSQKLKTLQEEGKKIVFTNGCFDLIHIGHLHILQEAKNLGDFLIVGLNADVSVKILKGETRPIKDENTRAKVLAAMQMVDAVVLFEEETPLNLIEKLLPTILVKGGDYIAENIVGYKTVTENGGKVIIVNYLEGNSTTELTQKIQKFK